MLSTPQTLSLNNDILISVIFLLIYTIKPSGLSSWTVFPIIQIYFWLVKVLQIMVGKTKALFANKHSLKGMMDCPVFIALSFICLLYFNPPRGSQGADAYPRMHLEEISETFRTGCWSITEPLILMFSCL